MCGGTGGITRGQNANQDTKAGFSSQPTPPAWAQGHSLPAKWLSVLEAGLSSPVAPGGSGLQALGSWEGRKGGALTGQSKEEGAFNRLAQRLVCGAARSCGSKKRPGTSSSSRLQISVLALDSDCT